MTELVALGTPMLAIELSQRSGGVALVRKGVEPLTVSITGGRRERDELLPAIRSVLESARVQVGDLATVAVDTGPGGFTGLRISIAAGQMLAEVSGAMVVGVPGAEVAAASTSSIRDGDRTGTILVVAATRNGTAWVTRLHRTDPDRDWRPVGTAELLEDPPDERFEVVLADAHLEPEWRAFFTASGIEIIGRPSAVAIALRAKCVFPVPGGPSSPMLYPAAHGAPSACWHACTSARSTAFSQCRPTSWLRSSDGMPPASPVARRQPSFAQFRYSLSGNEDSQEP